MSWVYIPPEGEPHRCQLPTDSTVRQWVVWRCDECGDCYVRTDYIGPRIDMRWRWTWVWTWKTRRMPTGKRRCGGRS